MIWRTILAWLTAPERRVYTSDDVCRAHGEGYKIGLAQGELLGRQALSHEIEQMFPPGHAISADDAATVKARQIH